MRTCSKCKIDKEDSDFAFRNKSKGILQGICRLCKRTIDNKDYNREGRKISVRKANKNARARIKKFLEDYKEGKCCIKCNDSRVYVLDFHHKSDKEFNIAAAGSRVISKKRLMAEILKCDLLCANCHRELHYLEKLEYSRMVSTTD